MVYKPDSAPSPETSKLKPWLKLAVWKAKAEEDLSKIEGLNLVVLRFANVYGPYVTKFLGTALCMARVYQSEEEAMEWLWGKDLRTNTVHVEDAARAMWTACEWYVGVARKKKEGKAVRPVPVFNVVDHGKTCEFYWGFAGGELLMLDSTRDDGYDFQQHFRDPNWLPGDACVFLGQVTLG